MSAKHTASTADAISGTPGSGLTPQEATDARVADGIATFVADRYQGGTCLVYGNSIAAGQNASTADLDFPTLLCAALGLTEDNRAVGGEQMYETANRARNDPGGTSTYTPGTDPVPDLVVICNQLNDVRRFGLVASEGLTFSTSAMAEILERLSAGTIVEQSAFAFSGAGWSADVAPTGSYRPSGGTGKNTTTDGNYWEYTFDGDEVTVHGYGQPTTRTLTVTYAIDGTDVLVADYAGRSPDVSGAEFPPIVERFTGLGSGSHTIRVTKTSGADALWADYLTIRALNPPPIVVVATLPIGDTAWTDAAFAPFNNGSVAAMEAYNRELKSLAATFPNVAVAWVPTFDKATMLSGDSIHPNDAGHVAYKADAVAKAAYLALAI